MLLVDSCSIQGVTYVIFRVTHVSDQCNSCGSYNSDNFVIESLIITIEKKQLCCSLLAVPHIENELCSVLNYERKAVSLSENAAW
jgi:hypothetical protein